MCFLYLHVRVWASAFTLYSVTHLFQLRSWGEKMWNRKCRVRFCQKKKSSVSCIVSLHHGPTAPPGSCCCWLTTADLQSASMNTVATLWSNLRKQHGRLPPPTTALCFAQFDQCHLHCWVLFSALIIITSSWVTGTNACWDISNQFNLLQLDCRLRSWQTEG